MNSLGRLKKLLLLLYKISHLNIDKIRMLPKLRNVGDYQKMSKQELEDLFILWSVPNLRHKNSLTTPRRKKAVVTIKFKESILT